MSEYTNRSFIKELMNFRGFAFQKKWGQNFLVNDEIITSIIHEYEIQEDDPVVEIGPGIGAITERLVEKTKNLTLVELDQGFSGILRERFADIDLIEADVLTIDPNSFQEGAHIVGNLPYYVTTPIIMHFLESKYRFKRLSFMMQKEVAERVVASPNTKEYGRLSIAAQIYSSPYLGLEIPPTAFFPQPKVTSTMVHFEKREASFEEEQAIKLSKLAFSTRRKTLPNALQAAFDKQRVIDALKQMDIDPRSRAETLSIDEYVELAKRLYEK